MKRHVLIFTIILQVTISFAQTKEQKKTEEWIEMKNIELNNPITPDGFYRQTDCKGRPIYRKEIADTIVLYSFGGSIAEDLETFKKTTKEEGYNTFRYPAEVQKNGTVVMTRMSKNVFIWHHDTLYLFDTYNEAAAKAQLKLMEDFFAKKITTEEYEKQLEVFDNSKFPFNPKFKMIYFKGIFDNSKYYSFLEDQNFRKEKVQLVNKWNENGKTYFEINLDTHTDGRFRFSENMKELERNNCKR